eukprot:2810534-Amphidinium_carterae.8
MAPWYQLPAPTWMSVLTDSVNTKIHECNMEIQASHLQSDDILTMCLHTQTKICQRCLDSNNLLGRYLVKRPLEAAAHRLPAESGSLTQARLDRKSANKSHHRDIGIQLKADELSDAAVCQNGYCKHGASAVKLWASGLTQMQHRSWVVGMYSSQEVIT